MKRKRFFAMLLCVGLAVSFSACNQNPSVERPERSEESRDRTEADEPDASKEETKPAQPKTETETVTKDEPEREEKGSQESEAEVKEGRSETEDNGSRETESVFSGDPVSAKVAVSSMNDLELSVWNLAAETAREKGVDLTVVPVDPYQTSVIEEILNNPEIDICSYGMLWSLDPEVEGLVSPVGYTYMSRMHLYSDIHKSVSELGNGEEVAIAPYHCEQGLQLLADAGLITLKDEMPPFPSNWYEEADAFIADYVESYLQDITITTYNLPMASLLESVLLENHNLVLSEYSMAAYEDDLRQKYGNSKASEKATLHVAIFEDPLTDERRMDTILARTEDTKDPEKLDLFEKLVESYQSQRTLDYLESIHFMDPPAGWDIDLIARYRE